MNAMQFTVELTLILLNLMLSGVIIGLLAYFLTGEQPEIPTVEELMKSLTKSDAGVASGRARLNKKIDGIMGSYMMEQFPIAQLVMDRVPALGEIMIKNPETISYIQAKANEYLGKMGESLPGDIGGFLQKLMGANLGQLLPQQPKQELE